MSTASRLFAAAFALLALQSSLFLGPIAFADCEVELVARHDIDHLRTEVFEHGKQQGLPMLTVKIHDRAVPVILLNRKTIQSWNPLLESTFGIATSLEPNNEADHGNFRLPGTVRFGDSFTAPGSLYEGGAPSSVLMDLFSPGMAGRNAMNGNGYRFKPMAGYFERRNGGSATFVDLAYSVSPEDRQRVWLYHAAKRIALIRIQYAFDEANNYWMNQQRRVLQRDGDRYWSKATGGFEQCNNCRLGGNAQTHVDELRGRMAGMFNKDVNSIYGLPETRRFLDDAKRDLLYRDWRDPNQYDPNFLDNPHYLGLMQNHLNPALSHEAKVDALAYLMVTNVFEEVIQLRNRLGIAESRTSQYGNPNITAILIYNDAPGAVEAFYSGRFEYFGARSGNGFSTNYFESHPVYQAWHWPQNWTQYVP